MHARTAIHVYIIAIRIYTPDITYMLFNFMQAWKTEQIQSLVYTTKQLNTIPEKTVSTFNVALISTSLSKIE